MKGNIEENGAFVKRIGLTGRLIFGIVTDRAHCAIEKEKDMLRKQYRRGLVALSADPVTYGHIDLVRRAGDKCDEVVVLVANNDRKKGSYCFPIDKRTEMVERAVREASIGNARIVGSSGLLVDVYLREGCDRLFRGVRNDKDLDFEKEQEDLNCQLLHALTGHVEYLPAAESLRLVSSTMVKALVELQCNVEKFVPLFVKQALEERLLRQYRITITGGISVGKSWVANELARRASSIPTKTATHINIDRLIRSLYREDSPGAEQVRSALVVHFGSILADNGRDVDRKALATRLFRAGSVAEEDRSFVTKLTLPHIERLYRSALAGAEGLVIVEWAQSAEMAMGSWTNNNVIVVDSDDRAKFAAERGISAERLAEMDKIQWSVDQKIQHFRSRCARENHGWTIRHQHAYHPVGDAPTKEIDGLFWKILKQMPHLPYYSKH